MYTQLTHFALAWFFGCILSEHLTSSTDEAQDAQVMDDVSLNLVAQSINLLQFEVFYPKNSEFLDLCKPTLLGAQVTNTNRLMVDYFATEMPVELQHAGQDRWIGEMKYSDDQIGKEAITTVFAGFVKGGDECFKKCPLYLESGFPSMLGPKERVILKKGKTTVTIKPWFCTREGASFPMQLKSAELSRSFDIDVHVPPSRVENPYVQPTILFAHDGFSAEASPASIGHFLTTLDKTQSLGYLKPLMVAVVNTTANNTGAQHRIGSDYGLEIFTPTTMVGEKKCKCPEKWSHWCKSSEIVELSWEKVKAVNGITGHADKYLDFLWNSVRTKLLTKYKLPNTTEIGNWGYGLAGLLSIYAAAARPSSFQYSFVGSPAMWWNCAAHVQGLADAAKKMLESKQKVYFDAGGGEGWGKIEPLPVMFDILSKQGFVDGKDVWLYMDSAAYMEPIAWTRRALQGMLAMFGSNEAKGLEYSTSRRTQAIAADPRMLVSPPDWLKQLKNPKAPQKSLPLWVEVHYPSDSKVFEFCMPQIFAVQASFNMDSLTPGMPVPLTERGKDRWIAQIPYGEHMIGQTFLVTVVVLSIQGGDKCFEVCPSFKQSAYPSMLGPKQPFLLRPGQTNVLIQPWFCEGEGKSEVITVKVPELQTTLPSGAYGQMLPTPKLGANFGVVMHRPPSLMENLHVNPTIVLAHDGMGEDSSIQQYSPQVESFLGYLDDMQTLGFMHPFLVVLVRSPEEMKVLTEDSISQVLKELQKQGYVKDKAPWLYLEPSDDRGPLGWTRRAIRGMLALFGTHEAKSLVYDGISSFEDLFSWQTGAAAHGSSNKFAVDDDDDVPDGGSSIMSMQAFLITCLLGCSAVGLVVACNRRSMFWEVPSDEHGIHARTWSFLTPPSETWREMAGRSGSRALPIRQPVPQDEAIE